MLTNRKAAITAGISILIIAISAIFSVGVVQNKLFTFDNGAVTANNILNSFGLYRAGIFGWLVTLTGDILISWALYAYLKQVDSSLALLGAIFRLIYSAILCIAVLNLIYLELLISLGKNSIHIQSTQLYSQVMLYANAFKSMWSLGLIIFGIHLFIIGYLVLKSNFIPKILGILLFIASISYIAIHFLYQFLPQFDNITKIFENVFSLPMAIGELGLGIWLILKGGKFQNEKI